jgi:hypothetical protein
MQPYSNGSLNLFFAVERFDVSEEHTTSIFRVTLLVYVDAEVTLRKKQACAGLRDRREGMNVSC